MAASPERNGYLGKESVEVLEPQPLEVIVPEVKAKKRNPAPGVRVVGRRIYDPENGKTCHQCRQKTTDFAAACKQVKKKGPCPIKYCRKCLLNRYGENAEEVAEKEDWICPKCRGICNCSFCRKKKGEMPTGIMAHIAKASGCTSVHDLLEKGSDVVAAAQAILKVNGSDKGTKRSRDSDAADEVAAERDESAGIDLNTFPGDEGDENIGVDLNARPSVCVKKGRKLQHSVKKNSADERSHDGDSGEPLLRDKSPVLNNNIALPRGTPVTNIAGAQLDDEDIGAAIQFLEFCRTFAEIFQIRKGQSERILQDVVGGRELRLVSSVVAEFHMNLLSVIQEGKGKKPLAYTRDGDAWVIDVGKYISESAFISKELPLDCLNQGVSGYKNLSPSCKLRVLNFLCDETLSTDKLRNWIDMQNDVAAEPMNAAREKARAAKEKEKELKERLKGNMDKTMLSSNEAAALSSEENKDLISQIKEAQEVKRTAINYMAAMEKQGSLWTKPLMVEKGLGYWKLDGYCNSTTILLQEYGDHELMANKDKWFMFTEDEEKVIEEHIARSRHQMRKRIRV
ncbi:hypothetical protein SEVIR_1G145200v4 [Setaria viridis]|uniref:DDT domain-containing protein n=2 Tax=Setaria TaxID=4554 RepID=A0A368PKD7_SETIT|nr:uncharacterized protein LOC101767231 isoform X2 [Setaria italica]XP_034585781.1 uncharacterized protein LOC117848459 isoform X2 [Setaria viridis]RCV06225.1 hypothetical protein SETIT_1G146500v2 [Setaria italica]TKW38906.1 hypothetical protein SEVIR_1G145200v2 [Setaria viridis]